MFLGQLEDHCLGSSVFEIQNVNGEERRVALFLGLGWSVRNF